MFAIEVESDAVHVIELMAALNNSRMDLSIEGPIFDEIRILQKRF